VLSCKQTKRPRDKQFWLCIDTSNVDSMGYQELQRLLRALADNKQHASWQDKWYDELPMGQFCVNRWDCHHCMVRHIPKAQEEVKQYVKDQYMLVVESYELDSITEREAQQEDATEAVIQVLDINIDTSCTQNQHDDAEKDLTCDLVGEVDTQNEFTVCLGYGGSLPPGGTKVYQDISESFIETNKHKEMDRELYNTLRSMLGKFMFYIHINQVWKCSSEEHLGKALLCRWIRLGGTWLTNDSIRERISCYDSLVETHNETTKNTIKYP
jgi:rubrerythrin